MFAQSPCLATRGAILGNAEHRGRGGCVRRVKSYFQMHFQIRLQMYIQGKINIWKCYRRCILMFPCLFACSGNVVRSTVPPWGDKVPKPLTNSMKLMNMDEDLFPTLKVFKLTHPNHQNHRRIEGVHCSSEGQQPEEREPNQEGSNVLNLI